MNRRRSGVTLLEVLVALALGVLLAAGVQTMVLRAHQVHEELRQRDQESRRTSAWRDLLRSDLAAMTTRSAFSLHDGRLELTSLQDLAADSWKTRSTVWVTYTAVPVGPALRLTRRQSRPSQSDPAPQEATSAGSSSELALVDGLRSVTFEVFDGRQWHAEWPLPAARRGLALRVLLQRDTAIAEELLVPLLPARWKRHDE